MTPSPRAWTEDELLDELRAWLENAESPSGTRYEHARRANPGMPSLSTICRRFGGWHQALEEVGLVREPTVFRRYTDAAILDALRRWIAAGGDGRAASYSRAASGTGAPSYNTVFHRFGSWRAALAAIGERPRSRRWTRDEVERGVPMVRREQPVRLGRVRAGRDEDRRPSIAAHRDRQTRELEERRNPRS